MKKLLVLCALGFVLFQAFPLFAGGRQNTETAPSQAAGSGTGVHVTRKVVNVGINADPGSLAPWANANTGRTAIMEQLFETLAHRVGSEIIPVIMKSYQIAGDGKSMDVVIWDTIYDSAGNHITARDVVFSYNRAKELQAVRNLTFIDRAETAGDYTARFHFNRALLIYDIESLFEGLAIVSQKAYEASPDGMATTPVSTGRYRVTKYTSGYIVTLEKNDAYWQKDESRIYARNQANTQTINYYIITEPSQMTMALEQGSIDMSWGVSNSDLYIFDKGGPQSAKYKVLKVADNLVMQFFCNGSTGKPTENEDLRKAIYYAVNKEVVLQSVYNGNGSVVYDTARPACPDYNPAWEKQDNFYHYNLDKAKEYLAKSGYRPGQLTLTLLVEGTETSANLAVLIQSFLSQIGINVRINTVQASILISTSQDANAWDLLLQGYAASSYVPAGYAYVFDANNYSWGGTICFIKDDRFQNLLSAARLLATHTQETVDAAHNYIVDHAYGMGLVNYSVNFVVPNWLDDMVLSYKLAILPGGSTYTE
jgi:ABC-type transport system substrate-binding protein